MANCGRTEPSKCGHSESLHDPPLNDGEPVGECWGCECTQFVPPPPATEKPREHLEP